MTTCDRQRGFTLLEVIVVLAVLGLLLGMAVPLAGAVVQADRRQEARNALGQISVALDSYYFEHAAFPASLAAADFLGVHLQPGPQNSVAIDPFGSGLGFVYAVDLVNNYATVYSRGENGIDDGSATEELVVRTHGAVPGTRRTMLRLRFAVEVLADHIEAGGSVAGTWSVVRAACGLPANFDTDGFGTAFQWTSATHTLTSAGPDRAFGTADDITI